MRGEPDIHITDQMTTYMLFHRFGFSINGFHQISVHSRNNGSVRIDRVYQKEGSVVHKCGNHMKQQFIPALGGGMKRQLRITSGSVVYKRQVGRDVPVIFVDKGLLQKTAVIVPAGVGYLIGNPFGAGMNPTGSNHGHLVFDGALRVYVFNTFCSEGGKFGHPFFPTQLPVSIVRILPVHFSWQFSSGFFVVAFPAGRTVAHIRPEGHVQKHPFKVIHGV